MSESWQLPTLDLTEGAKFGMGFRDTLAVAKPAAGASASIVLDSQYVHRLLSITASLATSIVVANRQLQVSATDQNGLPFWTITNSVTQAASLTQQFQLLNGLFTTPPAFAALNVMALPDMLLPRNAKITVSALNIDVGDQITVSPLFVEKFPHGKMGYPTGTRRIAY